MCVSSLAVILLTLLLSVDDWRWSIVLNGAPGVLMLLVLPLVPESPSWLVSKGRDEAAGKVRGVAHAHVDSCVGLACHAT